MRVEIINMDHKGNGIGKIDEKIIFIPKSVNGDICDISKYRETKKYDIGKINNIITKSDIRIDELCPYYKECGGCNISNLDYEHQLKFKEDKVKNIFKRYLNMEINPKVIGSKDIYHYRNKITYHVDNNLLGLVGEYTGIINIDKCLLVSEKINNLYCEIKKNDLSKVSKIVIKECDNGLILSVDGIMDIDNLCDKCISIYVNGECLYFKEDGYIKINNIKYLVSDKSFFQINTGNITSLYDEIVRYGDFKKNDKVIDLYCGVGSISLYIANYVNSVLGIEIVEEAIHDANKNAELNKIDNVEFLCGDVSKLINDKLNADTLIVDPPRIGLDNHTIDVINNTEIKKLIYVSCDPMTLVRDLKLLDNYKLEGISLVDMFPQTHHIESVVLLNRK